MGKRIYPLNRIKQWYCYDVEELCTMHKVHAQTVRQWVKNGLLTIDRRKPTLIYGADLKAFLGKLNKAQKCQTAFDQMFCLKCRDAKPFYRQRIYLEQARQYVRAKALCRSCRSIMNKTYKMDDIPKLRACSCVGGVLELYDGEDSPVNAHLSTHRKTPVSEPIQLDLFTYET